MKRTISFMVGKGSINHNRRSFTAKNVDADRTVNNVEYCYTPIKKVYHELFDDALKRYNEKQTRTDREIKNYYEKIRTGRQEKPFHEVIVQIGNWDNTNSQGEYADLAQKVLEEYYNGFAERNPQLKVFSAHLHLDEESPHLHIDFVPYITESKRGLDTRVSLKQALAKQGFIGKGRGATEWAMWAQSEKEQLAAVMERYGIEWEQKGTHEKHLSVLDYKKQEREKELIALEDTIASKQAERNALSEQIKNYDEGLDDLRAVSESLDTSPDFQLPEPQGLMSAKSYRTKVAEPLVRKLKSYIKNALARCFEGWDAYHRLNITNANLYRENEKLSKVNDKLSAENKELKKQNKDYSLLRKVFGNKQIDDLLERARSEKQSKQRGSRFRNDKNER